MEVRKSCLRTHGLVTHLGFVTVNRKDIATMGMEKTGWGANLLKIEWKLMILDGIK